MNDLEPSDDQQPSDDRSPMAQAIDKATEVFSACLMMVLPGIGGHFLDKYCNTFMVFTLAGVVFGLFAGFVQILKIVKKPTDGSKADS